MCIRLKELGEMHTPFVNPQRGEEFVHIHFCSAFSFNRSLHASAVEIILFSHKFKCYTRS